MRRLLGVLAAALLVPLAVQGQPQKTLRLAYLSGAGALPGAFSIAFRDFGLRELGWTEGSNLAVHRLSAGDRTERLKEFAVELVQGRPDVIVTEGIMAARAAKEATRSIPIVFVVTGDPVAAGLVDSLPRPGGNLTGITTLSNELAGKRLQLLAEVAPVARRVGVLWNVANPDMEDEWRQTLVAAGRAGIALTPLTIRGGSDIRQAVEEAVRQRVGGIVVLADALTQGYATDLVEQLTGRRIAAIYGSRVFLSGETARVPGGVTGLMSLAPPIVDVARAGASYVDRILKGGRPADLPVQQPTSFDLVVNRKAARAIGLTLPSSLLLRADVVIE